MNPGLAHLQPYPFEKLAALFKGVTPPAGLKPLLLSIGEPKHPTPSLILEALAAHAGGYAQYPATKGDPALRAAIAAWLTRRYQLPPNLIDAERHVLPVSGTREALFAIAQCVVCPGPQARVLMPNPFYQIYEGAALLAGAQPWFLNTTATTGFLPDLDAVPPEIWRQCQLFYACSPGNPSGAVFPLGMWQRLIRLARQHGFVLAADECYSELYDDETAPPPGLLQAAMGVDNGSLERLIVFHSLSKRSNAPGLRSGFVAGDPELLRSFLLYRTYHGCALPPPTQQASLAAWLDETHVADNRAQYRAKFSAVLDILAPALAVQRPAASFYLWAAVPGGDDAAFARRLYAEQHVTVLPGSYLSREAHGGNPGAGRVRIALVPPLADCIEAAQRIHRFVKGIPP
jgi:N-succinyldiaminopimelate aminotransferase